MTKNRVLWRSLPIVLMIAAASGWFLTRTDSIRIEKSRSVAAPPIVEEFEYSDAEPGHHLAYVRPVLERYLRDVPPGAEILDVGCGNGSLIASFGNRGWDLSGLDISVSAIEVAKKQFPDIRFFVGDATTDLNSVLGHQEFDVIISTEVIEHVYNPRGLVRNAFALLKPGGMLILSTPYHGYLKNLAIALFDRADNHFDPLSDHGHIKFFSTRTLSTVLWEAGFEDVEFTGAGRFRYMWKSMVMKAVRP